MPGLVETLLLVSHEMTHSLPILSNMQQTVKLATATHISVDLRIFPEELQWIFVSTSVLAMRLLSHCTAQNGITSGERIRKSQVFKGAICHLAFLARKASLQVVCLTLGALGSGTFFAYFFSFFIGKF
jgi:hypothetical protein